MCLELRYAKSGRQKVLEHCLLSSLAVLASNWLGSGGGGGGAFSREAVFLLVLISEEAFHQESVHPPPPPSRIAKAELFTICALATVRNLHPGVHVKFLDYCHSSCPLAFKSPYLRTHWMLIRCILWLQGFHKSCQWCYFPQWPTCLAISSQHHYFLASSIRVQYYLCILGTVTFASNAFSPLLATSFIFITNYTFKPTSSRTCAPVWPCMTWNRGKLNSIVSDIDSL